MAITEALGCGAPVVITETCHFPEVAEAGAGEVVATDSTAVAGALGRLLDDSAGPGELADAIRELAEAPEFAHRLGTAAHEHLIANHDWNDITKQTLGVALRAIGRST